MPNSIPIQRKGTSGYACSFPVFDFFLMIFPILMQTPCQISISNKAASSPIKAARSPSTTPQAAVSFTSPPPIPPVVIPAIKSGRHARSPNILGFPGGIRLTAATRQGIQSGMIRFLTSETAAKDRARKNKIVLTIHIRTTFPCSCRGRLPVPFRPPAHPHQAPERECCPDRLFVRSGQTVPSDSCQ